MVKRKNQALIDSDSSKSDISDLDSEFLNLAKKKTKNTKTKDNQKRNESNSDSSDSDSDSEREARKPPPKKRITDKKRKSSKSSDSESENSPGEISDKKMDSPAKDNSDLPEKPSSEPEEGEVSDSSGSSSEEEFNDGYDDQLMGDAEDRARLASLTEKERETEIFKRIEQRELMKTRFEIEKKLRQAKKAERAKEGKTKYKEPKDKSQNSSSEFGQLDHKERSTNRKKAVEENRGKDTKRVNAMAELKARREGNKQRLEEQEKQRREEQEQKEQKKKEKEEEVTKSPGKKEVKLKASDIYSDDSESDTKEPSPPRVVSRRSRSRSRSRSHSRSRSSSSSSSSESEKEDKKKSAYVVSRNELNQMRLSRHKLERFVHLPFFERLAKGCFVKLGIGQHNNMPVYRVAEITGVYETAKIYNLGKIKTNKGLRVRHGGQERVFRLEFVSNQEFSDAEYQKWLDACHNSNIELPSKESLEQKVADIREGMTYEYQEEDIDKIVQEKGRFKTNPYNYAMRKTQYMKDRDAAIARGDDDTAREFAQKLHDLEERAIELDRMRTSTISSISYINDRNRKRNVEEAERAILEELRASKGKKANDPFTRRSTKPRMNFKQSQEDKNEFDGPPPVVDITPAKLDNSKNDKNNSDLSALISNSNSTSQTGAPQTQDDLFSAHDFDIKIDLEVPLPTVPVSVTPKSANKELGPKRSLNLQDYKKKRGLI